MRISARFRDIRPIRSGVVTTIQSRIPLECSKLNCPPFRTLCPKKDEMSIRTSRLESNNRRYGADCRLFAVVSCNLRGSYNPGSGTGTSSRFADVSAVGTAVIVTLHAKRTRVRNSGGHLSPGTCHCLERHMQGGENNATKDAKEPRPGPSLIYLLRHADARRGGKAN